MTNKKLPCSLCGKYDNRGIAIDAIIIQNNQLLLIKRGIEPGKGHWAFPGGHIDFDEKVEDAVVREVKEETGLDVFSCTFFGIYSNPKRHPQQVIALVFTASANGIIRAGDDAEDATFFPLDNLPRDLAFDHTQIITDYLKKLRKKEGEVAG